MKTSCKETETKQSVNAFSENQSPPETGWIKNTESKFDNGLYIP